MERPTYLGRIGPGETLIPAVAGVEGSLIYFIDADSRDDWPGDFTLDAMADGGRRADADRPSLQCRAPLRIPDLVAVLQDRARPRGRAGGGDRRSPRRLLLPLAAQRQRRACASRSMFPTAAKPASRASSTPSAAPAISRSRSRPTTSSPPSSARAAARRRVPADPRQLLRRSRGPLRYRARPAAPACARSACSTIASRAASSCTSIPQTFRDRFFFEIVAAPRLRSLRRRQHARSPRRPSARAGRGAAHEIVARHEPIASELMS